MKAEAESVARAELRGNDAVEGSAVYEFSFLVFNFLCCNMYLIFLERRGCF